jgi:hypothetical protein
MYWCLKFLILIQISVTENVSIMIFLDLLFLIIRNIQLSVP